jgi:hypothetical protein
MIEFADRRPERPFGRKCANVQLVNDPFGNRRRRPLGIAPFEIVWVNHLRSSMNAGGIETRGGIGPRASLKPILVTVARPSVRINRTAVTAGLFA